MMVNPFLPTVQEVFLSLVPRIERHGRVFFRHVKCPHRKQDAVAEMVALAWKWFVRLVQRGKDPTRFPSALATFAARAVNSGRKLAGMDKAKDVLSPRAQKEKGFTVKPLPAMTRRCFHDIYALVRGQQELDAYEDRLRDNRVSPPDEQAAFRLDFPCFLSGLTERDRNLALYLSLGHGTKTAAAKFGVSPARVSQKRRELHQDWRRFHGEDHPSGPNRGVA